MTRKLANSAITEIRRGINDVETITISVTFTVDEVPAAKEMFDDKSKPMFYSGYSLLHSGTVAV
jgi:hypothetical protein